MKTFIQSAFFINLLIVLLLVAAGVAMTGHPELSMAAYVVAGIFLILLPACSTTE